MTPTVTERKPRKKSSSPTLLASAIEPEDAAALAAHDRAELVVERAGPARTTKERARDDDGERGAGYAEDERRDDALERDSRGATVSG